MESIDLSAEDEIAIQKLESTKNDLQNKIDKEVKGNAILQESLETRKEDLHERRLALERDIERLREQLQKERDLRASLETGLMNMRPGNVSVASAIDSKTKADLEEVALVEADIVTLKQKVADLRGQLKQSYASLCESCSKRLYSRDHSAEKDQFEDVRSIGLVDQHENLLKGTDALSGVACETVQVKEQELPSSKEAKPPPDQKRERTYQKTNSSRNRHSSSTKDSISKFSSKKEHTKTEAQGSPSSRSVEPLSEQLHANQSSTESPVLSCTSHSEDPTMTIHNSNSKSSTSKDENIIAADQENVVTKSQESVSSSDGQPSQKQRINIANQSSKASQGSNKVPSIEEPVKAGQTTASKKFTLWGDNVKKEAQDPSLSTKQTSRKQQPSNTFLNNLKSQASAIVSSSEELIVAGRSGAAKKLSSKPEETVSSSTSALTKLTNRLNFLKERRAQLVNELQFAQNSRSSGPDGPRNNSR